MTFFLKNSTTFMEIDILTRIIASIGKNLRA